MQIDDSHDSGASDYALCNDDLLAAEESLLGQDDAAVVPSSSPLTKSSETSLTYLNCLALVVSIQIGSAIFSTPAFISSHVSSPVGAILVWLLAGISVWTGASCFIELGTRISHNGGMQEYIHAGYGDFAGFLFSSVWITIVRPCSIAMIAMVSAEHIDRLFYQDRGTLGNGVFIKVLALLALWGLTLINCLGFKTGAKVANWFFIIKVLLVTSIILAGAVEGVRLNGGKLTAKPETGQVVVERISRSGDVGIPNSVWNFIGGYVNAVLAALWVFGGWNSLGFVAGDMQNPTTDLPRVLNSAMAIVTSSFTLTALALYIVLPVSVIRENDTPAITFAKVLYGHSGSLLYTIAIAISGLGSINANIFAVSRLVVSAAQRGYLPAPLITSSQQATDEASIHRTRWKFICSTWLTGCVTNFARSTAKLRLEEQVPM